MPGVEPRLRMGRIPVTSMEEILRPGARQGWCCSARAPSLSPSLLACEAIPTGAGGLSRVAGARDPESCAPALADRSATISAADILPERSAGTGPRVRTATTDDGIRLEGFGVGLEESGFRRGLLRPRNIRARRRLSMIIKKRG